MNCCCSVRGIVCVYFFFSSRRRHTRCALVTGVQTCALPIFRIEAQILGCPVPAKLALYIFHLEGNSELCEEPCDLLDIGRCPEIGRASCRERVCQYV